MTYLVVLTFDLKKADPKFYSKIEAGLDEIGLKKKLKSKKGDFAYLPNNTFAGKFRGKKINLVTKDFRNIKKKEVQKIFKKYKLRCNYFISVGTLWAWCNRDGYYKM